MASISSENTLQCVFILNPATMITYAHEDHSKWNIGDTFDVYLHDGTSVVCKVTKIDTKIDAIWLKPEIKLNIDPVILKLPCVGQIYIQLGFSANEQLKTSLCIQIGKNNFKMKKILF